MAIVVPVHAGKYRKDEIGADINESQPFHFARHVGLVFRAERIVLRPLARTGRWTEALPVLIWFRRVITRQNRRKNRECGRTPATAANHRPRKGQEVHRATAAWTSPRLSLGSVPAPDRSELVRVRLQRSLLTPLSANHM